MITNERKKLSNTHFTPILHSVSPLEQDFATYPGQTQLKQLKCTSQCCHFMLFNKCNFPLAFVALEKARTYVIYS